MSSHWESEADRTAFRYLVTEKVRELAKLADADSKSVFNPTSPEYPFVAVLVSGIAGCVKAEAIAEGLEFDADFVNEVAARLRANHLWSETEYVGGFELSDGECDGDTAFYLHLNVAKGLCSRREDGSYAVTPSGVQHVEGLLRRKP